MQHLEGWSGPYTTAVQTEDGREETFEYFYNSRTQTTTWDNPVAEHEYTLSTRYWILHRVLFPEEDLEPMPPVGEASSPLLKFRFICSSKSRTSNLRRPLPAVERRGRSTRRGR